MSRIGNKPITVPADVEIKVDGTKVTVKGPKGTLEKEFHKNMKITVDGNVESVDTDALIAELTESVTDKRLIDRIADALIKRDKRIARMGGI